MAAAETTVAFGIAHTAAGGEPPLPGWLLVVAVTAYWAGSLVLRDRTPIRVVLPALVAVQMLLHAWLVTLSGHAVTHGGAHDAGSGVVLGLTWQMLLAHLAAGAVAALAWALRRKAVSVLAACDGAGRATAPEAPYVAPASRPRAVRPVAVLRIAPTRGPPPTHTATA